MCLSLLLHKFILIVIVQFEISSRTIIPTVPVCHSFLITNLLSKRIRFQKNKHYSHSNIVEQDNLQKNYKNNKNNMKYEKEEEDNRPQKVIVHNVKSPFLSSQDDHDDTHPEIKYTNVLIILNSPIHIQYDYQQQQGHQGQQEEKHQQHGNVKINPIFDILWNISSYKVCADGGANRLYDIIMSVQEIEQSQNNNAQQQQQQQQEKYYLPNVIKGDLDSIHPNVLQFFQINGCDIIKDLNQDTNDLDKALDAVQTWWDERVDKNDNIDPNNGIIDDSEHNGDATNDNNVQSREKKEKIQIYIYGAFGGRFDQEMASIQALYKWANIYDYRIFLYNHETCCWLLKPMKLLLSNNDVKSDDNDDCDDNSDNSKDNHDNNVIIRNDIQIPFYGENDNNQSDLENQLSSPPFQIGEGPTCGLIPIGCKVNTVKTKGFKWNLDGSQNSSLEFGGLVSSSNRAMDEILSIYTSEPLIFTAEIILSKA